MTLTKDRSQLRFTSRALQSLKSRLSGRVIMPGDGEYDTARQVQNTLYDRHPSVIVRAANASDVASAVRFAREKDLPLAVRSGGHNFVGYSVVDEGVVVDLSKMKGISIDPSRGIARVQPGVTSGELAPRAQEFGLALSTGDVSSVGIGGLTLGGGIGWLVRKYGLTIDHLLSAQIVTADGQVLTASANEHPDLFWAIRGGGGNFGIATEFEFQLQPAGTVLAGALFLPATREVIRGHIDVAGEAPDGLTTISLVMQAPPLPFIPAEHHGKLVYAILVCYVGDPEEGQKVVAPLRSLAAPIADLVSPMPYPAIYDFTTEGTVPGPFTVRSMFMDELPDDMIDIVLDQAQNSSSPMNMLEFRVLGGAMSRVPKNATAFAHRDKQYMFAAIATWEGFGEEEKHRTWTQETWRKLEQYGSGVYVNFLEDEGQKRIRQAYPPATYARLAVVKRRYDPTNLFRRNQNILPQA